VQSNIERVELGIRPAASRTIVEPQSQTNRRYTKDVITIEVIVPLGIAV